MDISRKTLLLCIFLLIGFMFMGLFKGHNFLDMVTIGGSLKGAAFQYNLLTAIIIGLCVMWVVKKITSAERLKMAEVSDQVDSVCKGGSSEYEENDVWPSKGKQTAHQQPIPDSSSSTAEGTPILTENETDCLRNVDGEDDNKTINLETLQGVKDKKSEDAKEMTYYLRFIAMFIDVATDTVRTVFFHLTPRATVDIFFASDNVKKTLKSMKKRNILNGKECKLVERSSVKPEHFDISLLITLLTNLYRGKLGTIAADLLRLREIRNTIFAHQPKARLEKIKFKRLWDSVEVILVRLTEQVDSNNVKTLKRKIEDIAKMRLNPNDEHYRKYLNIMQKWFDDVLKLQNKVEVMVKEIEGVRKYFKNKPIWYSRYIRLLFEGGKTVLYRMLKMEISKPEHPLQLILQDKFSFLKEKIGDEKLLKQLFPNLNDIKEISFDIDNWDIAVLAAVKICVLSDKGEAEEETIDAVTTILEARKNYAQSDLLVLDNEKYTYASQKLLSSISILCLDLDADTRSYCKNILATFNKLPETQNNDDEKYFEELKSHGPGIKSIVDTYNDTLKKLKERVKVMDEKGIPFLNYHVLDLKIVTLGNNDEKRKIVEDAVATVWQAAVKRSEDSSNFSVVRQAVDLILGDLRRIPDVEVGNQERRCILFFLSCYSWRGIFQLIEYFESSLFKHHMQSVSVAVGLLYDETISIQGNLTFECLAEILNHLDLDNTDNTVSVPIKCSSVRGMKEVLKVLSDEQTTNRLNEIADILSETEGEISLNVFPEVHGFKGVFDETDSESSGSGHFNFGEEVYDTLPGNKNLKTEQEIAKESCISNSDETPILKETESVEGFEHAVNNSDCIERIHQGTSQGDKVDSVCKGGSSEYEENDVSPSKGKQTAHQQPIPDSSSSTAEGTPILTENETESLRNVDGAVDNKTINLVTLQGDSADSVSERISFKDEENDVPSGKRKLNEHQQPIPTAEGKPISTKIKTGSFVRKEEVVDDNNCLENLLLQTTQHEGVYQQRSTEWDEEQIYLKRTQQLELLEEFTFEKFTISHLESCEIKCYRPSIKQCTSLLRSLSKAPLIKKLTLNTVRVDTKDCEDSGYNQTNACSDICEELIISGVNHNLESCEITHCVFSHEGLLSILACISGAVSLKELNLDMVRCVRTRCEGHDINLSSHKKLKSLALNYFDKLCLSDINPGLESCEIRWCEFSHEGMSSLSSCLSRAINLKTLTFENVKCSDTRCEDHYVNLSKHKTLGALMLQTCRQLTVKGLVVQDHLDPVDIKINNCEFSHKQWRLLSFDLECSEELKLTVYTCNNKCTSINCDGHAVNICGEEKRLTPKPNMSSFDNPSLE